MGKNPAFQFYPGDWTRDLDDESLELEGAWIRICCRLWWSQGRATKSLKEWSNVLRTHPNKTGVLLKTLLTKNICDGEYLDNQNITIISRRIVRDVELSEIRRRVGKLGGNPKLIKNENDLVNQVSNQTSNQKPTPSSSTSKINNIYIESFNKFYQAYPRHIGKQAALKAWLKIKPDDHLLTTILMSLEVQKKTIWNGKEQDFIPHPATWLNGKRWEDEVSPSQKEKQGWL